MPVRLDRSSADFDERFGKFLAAKREVSADVEAAARAIVQDVATRGDAALIEATKKYDRLELDASGLRVTPAEIEAAVKACDASTLDALKFARDRIETFHRRQMPKDEHFTDAAGVELGWRWSAVEAVGLYVPGGTAAYPSSVLMNAVPATVAGVARLVMVVPSPGGQLNPLVLAAAQLGGVSEIYRVGGAQAVAALAYGTATIAPVAKIVGPGNAYVAAAKLRRGQHQWIELTSGRWHHHHQPRNAGNCRRHRVHQHRRRVGCGAAGNIEADGLDRAPAPAELDASCIDKTLVLRQLLEMERLDAVAGECQRVECGTIAGI